MGSGSKAQTVGYKYHLGAHLILCHGPIDKITKIEFDDKPAWTGNATGGPITIAAESLFGGEEREGGVSGDVDIDMGRDDQTPNSYLVSKLGEFVPGFRGVVGVIFKQLYIGMNPYLKNPAFWGQRILVRQNGIAQWYSAKAAIGQDMNPAHILRECLTDPDWGMGYPEADIDDATFTEAADQLHAESMGMSLLWDQSVEISEFIDNVLSHIDGSLFVDRNTGKFKLKLARDNYDIDDLLVLDEDSIEKITGFSRNTVGELINSVTVGYWDATTGKDNSVTVQDISLVASQQGVISTTKQFKGFTNGIIATKVAERELRALSSPLASGTLYCTRKAAALNIGDVFALSWPKYGITKIVMRVANIELGVIGSDTVKITAVEDVFALSSAIYSAPPNTGWVDPNNPPAPCLYHKVMEAPYWELVQRIGENDAEAVDSTSGYIVATGVRPTSDAGNAKIFSNYTGTGYQEAGTVDFCPTCTISADITEMQTVIPVSGFIDEDTVPVGAYACIGDELVVVTAVSTNSITIGRGVLDTVPVKHPSGTRIFFTDIYFDSDNIEYAVGETAKIKLLPTTAKGTLAVGSAPEQTVSIAARHYKPYPPGNFKINTEYYPNQTHGPLVTSWAHRDRLQQTATLIDTTVGNIGPEVGTTYNISVETNPSSWTILRNTPSLSTTSWDWSTESTDVIDGQGSIQRVQLYSVRDSVQSYQRQIAIIERCGLGYNLGNYLGG